MAFAPRMLESRSTRRASQCDPATTVLSPSCAAWEWRARFVRRSPSTTSVRISMPWSPRSCVFRQAGDIANCNLSGNEKIFHLVPATVLDLVVDIFHNPLEGCGQRFVCDLCAFQLLHS